MNIDNAIMDFISEEQLTNNCIRLSRYNCYVSLLHKCCYELDFDNLVLYLEVFPHVINARDSMGNNLLIWAIRAGDNSKDNEKIIGIIELLLGYNIDYKKANYEGMTYMQIACARGSGFLLEFFEERQMDDWGSGSPSPIDYLLFNNRRALYSKYQQYHPHSPHILHIMAHTQVADEAMELVWGLKGVKEQLDAEVFVEKAGRKARPIDLAFSSRNRKVIKFLLEKGARCDGLLQRHASTLFQLQDRGNTLLQQVLANGAKLNERDYYGKHLLYHAIEQNRESAVAYILDYDSEDSLPLEPAAEGQHSVLDYAVAFSSIRVVQLLLIEEESRNKRDGTTYSLDPIIIAIRRTHTKALTRLLSEQKPIDNYLQILLAAIGSNSAAYVERVLARCPKNEKVDWIEAIKFALEQGVRYEIVKLLVKKEPECLLKKAPGLIEVPLMRGYYLIAEKLMRDFPEQLPPSCVVFQLLDSNDGEDSQEQSLRALAWLRQTQLYKRELWPINIKVMGIPQEVELNDLHVAAMNDRADYLSYILERDGREAFAHRSEDHHTVAHIACIYLSEEALNFLTRHDLAEEDIADYSERYPAQYLLEAGALDLLRSFPINHALLFAYAALPDLEALLEAGYDPTNRDEHGRTFWMHLIQFGNAEVEDIVRTVEVLLAKGYIDPEESDAYGDSFADYVEKFLPKGFRKQLQEAADGQ